MNSTVEDKVGESSLLKACEQREIIQMSQLFKDVTNLEKIGEGIFGECYQGMVPRDAKDSKGQGDQRLKVVFKVLPIQGTALVNGEKQKLFGEVEPEVVISGKLTELVDNNKTSCFVSMFSSFLAFGEYPPALVHVWDTWNDENESDNDIPTHFPAHQKYLVLVLGHVGEDIGHYDFKNLKQMFYSFMQVIHALAVAESELEFEHRDLHGNNILIRPTKEESAHFIIRGKSYDIPTCGVSPSMIDFTFSRIKGGKKSCPIFLDMSNDEEMFMSTGDYQYDIYRMMRDENRNEWGDYHPKTNVFWMHYLVSKILHLFHKYIDSFEGGEEDNSYKQRLTMIRQKLLTFSSCEDFVGSDFCTELLAVIAPPSLKRRQTRSMTCLLQKKRNSRKD